MKKTVQKEYISPNMEALSISAMDIITTSGGGTSVIELDEHELTF